MATTPRKALPFAPVTTPILENGDLSVPWRNYFLAKDRIDNAQSSTGGSISGDYVVYDNGTPFTEYPPQGGLVVIDSGGPLG